jgi:hypothetical protein
MKKKQSNKWSIQIDKSIAEHLKQYCKNNGYKISGLAEQLILNKISNVETAKVSELCNGITASYDTRRMWKN